MAADNEVRRVLSWNAKVNRDPKAVCDGLATLIENTDPDVITLQEFGGYVGKARDRFGKHWWVYAKGGWDESQMCPVMTRKSKYGQKNYDQKDGWGTLRTHTAWVGPQGGTHQGRTWTWVKAAGLWILSIHRATGLNDQNKAAAKDEHDTLVKWIGNHTPCLILGDHNCGSGKEWPNSSRDIAHDAKAGIDASGTIDYAIQRQANGTVVVKNKHGSDHEAVLWKRA